MWPGQQWEDDKEYVSGDYKHNHSKNPECFRDVSKKNELIKDLDTKDADNKQRVRQDSLSKISSWYRKSDL